MRNLLRSREPVRLLWLGPSDHFSMFHRQGTLGILGASGGVRKYTHNPINHECNNPMYPQH